LFDLEQEARVEHDLRLEVHPRSQVDGEILARRKVEREPPEKSIGRLDVVHAVVGVRLKLLRREVLPSQSARPLCSVPLRVGELQVFEAAMKTHVRKELSEQRFRHRARAKPELRRRKLELSCRDA